ncbi:glutaredoxin domain-containing protein [Corynebacterium lujinxingii]|uniref:NrdH-redoxin n=1 Tax=Corynebacterium lujinxingii TaxID=2763010 RepID=A0A7H0K0E1_9CORY|nr:glutaredoxin domain-containing protein [Corynebacterium lujinxingii]MBC3179506.1 NrdH-redoxin [Corynebacterium lujinxingii]NNO11610.1 NrdH-redoxin [Corynebacterium lujinxingii]QNP90757.1 NrdH-redoxin [Corynebacterium lujinxingii]
MSVKTPETNAAVTIFAADWCPFCRKLRERLDRTETPYDLVDVEAGGMDEVNEWIMSVNDGNRIVPTVLYSDGTHATNPEASAVRAKLRELTGEE